jgi:hypothetical protein
MARAAHDQFRLCQQVPRGLGEPVEAIFPDSDD